MKEERYCLKCKDEVLLFIPYNTFLKNSESEYFCRECKTIYRENLKNPGILIERKRISEY
jgi:hypothetical protein